MTSASSFVFCTTRVFQARKLPSDYQDSLGLRLASSDLSNTGSRTREPIDVIDPESSFVLHQNSFGCAYSLAHTLKIDRPTIMRHLEQGFSFHCLNLEWVPHLSGAWPKETRVQGAGDLLSITEKGKATAAIIWSLDTSHGLSFDTRLPVCESFPKMTSCQD
jgi:hypothetical protein